MNRHSKTYRTHIASRAWVECRKYLVTIRPDKGCQRCGSLEKPLDCHHLHYRTLGKETLADVRFLCRPCHDIEDWERAERERIAAEQREQEREVNRDEAAMEAFLCRRYGSHWEERYTRAWGEERWEEEQKHREDD